MPTNKQTTSESPSCDAACSRIVEAGLTAEQVTRIHSFGECWINNYDPMRREYWEKALWLWAWDKPIVWKEPRVLVPTGIDFANASVEQPAPTKNDEI